MSIPVFISHPSPHLKEQVEFIDKVSRLLESHGLEIITPGRTEYDTAMPMTLIKRTIERSHGLICIAFRRTYVKKAFFKHKANVLGLKSSKIKQEWLTSPFCQIEPAMAYQANLPVVVLREDVVYQEGLLDKGAANIYIPEFSLEDGGDRFLASKEWTSILEKWEHKVRAHFEQHGSSVGNQLASEPSSPTGSP